MSGLKLTGRMADINIGFIDGKPKLTVEVNEKNELKAGYDELKDCEKLAIEIKPYRKARSLSANGYLWVLCGKLAEKIGISKEDVYRQHIINMGIYRPAEISENAVDTLIKLWKARGIGWITERIDYGAHDGFVLLHMYYGSSVYNTKQMSRLLDSVIEDCKEQGIQTMTPDEIANMKSLWKAEKI